MGQLIQLENFARLKPYAGMFAEGLAITVLLALFTVLIGFILALLLALMRMSNFRPFRALGLNRDGHLRDGGFLLTLSKFNPLSFIATAYVEVIRSTPMMVQILIIYLGVFSVIQLPKFSIFGFIESQRFIPGVVALGMNSGAYLCEIIRSGIQSIDGGQTEAARSLGLSQRQNLRFIILPQAVKNILPALGNEFVVMVKETSLASVFFVGELMTSYKTVQSTTFLAIPSLTIVGIIYFILNFILTKILKVVERRLQASD